MKFGLASRLVTLQLRLVSNSTVINPMWLVTFMPELTRVLGYPCASPQLAIGNILVLKITSLLFSFNINQMLVLHSDCKSILIYSLFNPQGVVASCLKCCAVGPSAKSSPGPSEQSLHGVPCRAVLTGLAFRKAIWSSRPRPSSGPRSSRPLDAWQEGCTCIEHQILQLVWTSNPDTVVFCYLRALSSQSVKLKM